MDICNQIGTHIRHLLFIAMLVLTLTSSAMALQKESIEQEIISRNFSGTISLDSIGESKASLLDLSTINISVYESIPRGDLTNQMVLEFDEVFAFSISPNEYGKFHFVPPSAVFSITIEVNSLPEGYGIDHHTRLYEAPSANNLFALSAVDDIKISMASIYDAPSVMLLNSNGDEIYADYTFTPEYTANDDSFDSVGVSGVVALGATNIFNVSTAVDLTDLDLVLKIGQLHRMNLIDDVERAEQYIKIIENGMSTDYYMFILDELMAFRQSETFKTAPRSLREDVDTTLVSSRYFPDFEPVSMFTRVTSIAVWVLALGALTGICFMIYKKTKRKNPF